MGVLWIVSEGEFVTKEGSLPPPQGCVNPTSGTEVGGEIDGVLGAFGTSRRWCEPGEGLQGGPFQTGHVLNRPKRFWRPGFRPKIFFLRKVTVACSVCH